MKNIVMAAGYATRLYPLTKNFPKPLLKIGDNTILGRLLDDIDTVPEISEHIIVTNHKFADIFTDWAAARQTPVDGPVTDNLSHTCSADSDSVVDSHPAKPHVGTGAVKPITIVDDGTETNETRLGAVRDLLLAIDQCHIDEDILVIAADNILDFSFKSFVDYFKQRQTSMIMCHYEPEIKRLQRTGVIKVDNDENLRVLEMQEKPSEPASHWAVPPFYLYSRHDLPLIKDSLNHGCGSDAPGSLIKYLCPLTPIHAYHMPGRRFDIGSLDSYEEAKAEFGGEKFN